MVEKWKQKSLLNFFTKWQRNNDKAGNYELESGNENQLQGGCVGNLDREEQTKWKWKWENFRKNCREILRGLFVTNKNAMKYDVCIKPKKQNVLTDGTNNFKTSTLK